MRLIVFLFAVWAFVAVATSQAAGLSFINPFTQKPVITYTPSTITTTAPSTIETCTTDDNREGFCVIPSLCSGGNIKKTGVDNFVKTKERSLDSSSCSGSKVCCGISPPTVATTVPPSSSIPPTNTPGGTHTTIAPVVLFPAPDEGCGRGDTMGFRAFGEDTARYGEFPWVVPIFKFQNGKETFVAGGSLIHPRLVLTYATQFNRRVRNGYFMVKAGDYDLVTNEEMFDHQTIKVEKVLAHDKFNSGSMTNNIAILVLKNEVRSARNIGYMCLPNVTTRPTPGADCIVVGWGAATLINKTIHNVPKMMTVPLVDRDACLAQIRPYTKPTYTLDSSVMCAGGVDFWDVCHGDGGSPLFCEDPGENNRYYQVGIVSWGLNCSGVIPSMYSDVAALRPWIDSTIAAEGFDGKHFTP